MGSVLHLKPPMTWRDRSNWARSACPENRWPPPKPPRPATCLKRIVLFVVSSSSWFRFQVSSFRLEQLGTVPAAPKREKSVPPWRNSSHLLRRPMGRQVPRPAGRESRRELISVNLSLRAGLGSGVTGAAPERPLVGRLERSPAISGDLFKIIGPSTLAASAAAWPPPGHGADNSLMFAICYLGRPSSPLDEPSRP